MKKILLSFFLTTVFILQLYSQPTSEMIDVQRGTQISFNVLQTSKLDTYI